MRDDRDVQVSIRTKKESEIETATNNFNEYKGKSERAKQYQVYYKYAEAIYNWVNKNYSAKDKELRSRLADNVSKIFDNMYAGQRRVTIDDKYNINLTTTTGEELDLTGGLRVIQYFAYVGGLVKLAYDIMLERKNGDDEANVALGEQYPLVLDAALFCISSLSWV